MKPQTFKQACVNWTYEPGAYAAFLEEAWPLIDKVPGRLGQIEAFFLYQSARSLRSQTRGIDLLPAHAVLEIGSFRGRSSVALGLGLQRNPEGGFRLYCLDPFFDEQLAEGFLAEFRRNIAAAGLTDIVECIPSTSKEAVQRWPLSRPLAMLWIDGNHEYEHVRDDLLCWLPFLNPGGIVAFHDWYLLGVREALLRHFFPNPCLQEVAVIDYNLVAARKVDAPPTCEQRATKKRMEWALRTGSTSPWLALLAMTYEVLSRPFGNLHHFFRETISVTRQRS
ncbi:MAG: class I SAM-dependent methyltransferase [Candidatus Tectomicrobia bacterium]|nr:class I SAM-dependent methyltransferase [Candidatus Tectomicrobia bacterium]